VKIRTAVLLAAVCLLLPVLPGVSAASPDDIPTLFHNDEAWYKDEMAPALLKDGVFHVPGDFIALFDYITFSMERNGDNLLFVNTQNGDYLSILYSARAACFNGRILENVSIFRENGYYYIDAEFLCGCLGLSVEYSGEALPSDRSVRIYDESRAMTFDELLALYEEEEPETEAVPEEPAVVPPAEKPAYSPTRIYLICRDTASSEYVLARSAADQLGIGYCLFLTADTEDVTGLNMRQTVGLAVSTPEEADRINSSLYRVYRRKTHLVLSTGDTEADSAFRKAGYCILTPDFTVEHTTDAEVMFGEIVRYAEQNKSAVVVLEDVWQSETLLLLLETLYKDYYTVGKIDGIN